MKNSELKRPWPLIILACCFILAPFVNLALALYAGQNPSWYNPSIWLLLFTKLSWLEKLIYFAEVLVGGLLLRQNKRSWAMAFLLVAFISVYNIFLSPNVQAEGLQILSSINLFSGLGILGILYFFRYPYLDRRESIVGGPAKRFNTNIEVEVEGFGKAKIKNISATGCLLEPTFEQSVELNKVIKVTSDEGLNFELEVKHTFRGIGGRFVNLTSSMSAKIADIIAKSKKSAV